MTRVKAHRRRGTKGVKEHSRKLSFTPAPFKFFNGKVYILTKAFNSGIYANSYAYQMKKENWLVKVFQVPKSKNYNYKYLVYKRDTEPNKVLNVTDISYDVWLEKERNATVGRQYL